MKFLIITTDPTLLYWKKLPGYKKQILNAINKGKNIKAELEIVFREVEPIVRADQRISHVWLADLMKPYFDQGYDIIGFHMGDKQRTRFAIKPTLRGVNPLTDNEIGDFYFWSDENTKRKDRGDHPQFVQTFLHELAHEYFWATKQKDITHEYHDTHKDIRPLFATFDWGKYQPERMALKYRVSVLQKLVLYWEKLRYIESRIDRPRELQPLVKRQADKVVEAMAMLGHPVRITEGYRSMERQAALYAQGRTAPGQIVTNAKPGESLHNYGVAVDFVFRREGYDAPDWLWEVLGSAGKAHGFSWGGDWEKFVDKPHFEMALGYNYKDFQSADVDYFKFR